MKNRFKHTLSLILALIFMGQVWVSPAAIQAQEEQTEHDEAFARAASFLGAIGVLSEEQLSDGEKPVNRGEYAAVLTKIYGLSPLDMKNMATNNPDKYLNFGKDTPVKDDWYWEGDLHSEESVNTQTATPYYDVSQNHKLWEDIKVVSALGLMRGYSDRYFKPEVNITLSEAIKPLIAMLGYEANTNYDYPMGYMLQASTLKLLQNLKDTTSSNTLTVRDMSVVLYETLHTKVVTVHKISSNGSTSQSENLLFMTAYLDIFSVSDIVGGNENTRLDNGLSAGKQKLLIGGTPYINLNYSGEELLGLKVTAYYKVNSDDEPEIIYIEEVKNRNELLSIEADDVIGFSNHVLSYYENDRRKDLTIEAKADVIYNGKALTKYEDSDLIPNYGRIVLIDNNRDGNYDVVKVEKFEYIVVADYDRTNNIIYDKYRTEKKLELEDTDYCFLDTEGKQIDDTAVNTGSVLSVKATLPDQGKQLITVIVSNNVFLGTVSSKTSDVDNTILEVEGKEYTQIKDFFGEADVGDYGKFGLTPDGELAYFERADDGKLSYGYVAVGKQLPGLSERFALKLYGVDGEFTVHELSSYVELNGARKKAKETYGYLSGAASVKNQLIRYALDEGGMINRIVTPDQTDDLYTTVSSPATGTYRSKSKMLLNTKVVACFNDKSIIMYVPAGDKTDEDNYGTELFSHDISYTIDEAYRPSRQGITNDVAIIYVNTVEQKMKANVVPILLDKVVQTIINGDEAYLVTGLYNGSSVSYTVENPELFEKLKDWHRGDTVRLQTNPQKNVTMVEKVYDVTTRKLVGGVNPVASTDKLISEFMVLHGEAYSKPEEDGYLIVAPYVYTTNPQTGAVTVHRSETQSDYYTYLAKSFVVQIYDTQARNGPYTGTYKDVIDSATAGKGDELLIYTYWWDNRYFTIYR